MLGESTEISREFREVSDPPKQKYEFTDGELEFLIDAVRLRIRSASVPHQERERRQLIEKLKSIRR